MSGGRLTTHVLDTVAGGPAVGMTLDLVRLDGEARVPVGSFVTNADGRCDAPLLAGAALLAGEYELVFAVGAWRGDAAGFYDAVPIRFRIADAGGHYHVPLIIAPFGYSTYRGS
jgi:5-hydroxyisourate hydrolase